MTEHEPPRISVVVVSDYVAGDDERHDEFRMMRALKAQDIAEPFEIVRRAGCFPETRPLSPAAKLMLQIRLTRERLHWEWRTCRKAAHRFIRWYDWPIAILLLVAYRVMEWPSQGFGLTGTRDLPSTPYR